MSQRQKQDTALLGALFLAKGHLISRQDLACRAGVAAGDLESFLAPYMEAGYPVIFHPNGGVGLQEPPDIWCAEEIAGRCVASERSLTWDPLILAETASTNDVAREQGRKGTKAGFVVAASRQTRGRGRLGRQWESPPNRGLYVSILLRPDLAMAETGRLTVLSSVAAVDAVEAVAGFRPQIKWPNDLLVEGRKLAGLLIETEREGARLTFAVVGLGINVRHEADDFSPEVRGLATSLRLVTGETYRRADVLVALLQAFERRLGRPFGETREAWESSSLTLGQRVTLTTARGVKHGQAVGLDESGALLLRGEAGEVEVVTAGDMNQVKLDK
jgi:BirA family biotin operon repressor/biotin-[acetyl-CoA-carboxylase] ligase